LFLIEHRFQDFKLGGAHLKKLRRAEGGTKIFGVFRVKNHDFMQKNHIFSNFRDNKQTKKLNKRKKNPTFLFFYQQS
jgi:hypothetical protein